MPIYRESCVRVVESGNRPGVGKELAEIEANGGTTAMPKAEIPGVVTFAMFKDPAGGLVGPVEGGE